ncbi:hypothetical protein PCANB_001945, partial [Pneumocystis canis]
TMTKTSTITSKVTIVSTKKCQPTQCTTDRTHPTHGSGGEEAGDVKPSGGIRVNGWGTSGMILMIRWIDIDLGREGVQMLKKRDQVGKGEEMGEEELLALILKEDAMKDEDNCKKKLENYCKTLSDAGLKSKQVHEKLEGYCENGKEKDEKCKQLKTIKEKCTKLQKELENALTNQSFDKKKCEKYEPQCLFLGACSEEVIKKCSKLRNRCYSMKRMNVAVEILARALKGELKEGRNKECEEKLKKHCIYLASMSQELMEKCLDSKETCESLKKAAEEKCNSLEAEIKEVKNVKKDRCHSLLEQCYFYEPNCEETKDIKTKCDQLRKKCDEDYDILYTPPEEPWFPIQPRVSIIEKVGLKELYKAIAQEGVLINKLKLPSMDDLIILLSQKSDNGEFNQKECEKINKDKENCEYLKELLGDSDYNCTSIEGECKRLKTEFQQKRKDLEERIKDTRLFNKNNGHSGAEIIPWHKLYPDFYGRKCAQLQSDCFFLTQYNNDLKTECDNIQAMCYSRGLNLAAYYVLESQMRGEFRDSRLDWIFQNGSKKCQEKLVKVCNGVKNQSYHLLALCVHPEETCEILYHDIRDKTDQLKDILDITRDSPEEDHCLELEPECYKLKEDDRFLLGFCHTLERNCYHLRESQKMRNLLLKERQNYFENIENCTSILDKKCQNWLRKVNKQFKLSCALQNDTCRIMSFNTSLQCENLIKNINQSNIVTELNKADGDMDELRKLCPRWRPYCDALLPSCPKLKGNNNVKLCKEIQELCQPYQERQAVEDAVLYEFRGNLNGTDTCNTTLEERCSTWTRTGNSTFSSLCNDTNGSSKNDEVKKELCERLVDRVKKLCKKLPKELEKEKEELTERVSTYEKLKKEAEEEANKTNVILTFTIKNNSTNKTNNTPSHALVKRSEHHPTITETEAHAFDLVAIVTGEYVELKEKCEKLLLDCGFRECEGSESPCSKINETCNKLEPLKMRPPQTITKTETTTEKVTVDSEGKPICTSGAPSINMNCTSIHTTDTWVTHTSTHTSTKTQTSTITSKVTIVSTKKCQPTQCTTDRTHPTHGSGGEEAGEVKPSGGIRVNGWGAKGIILIVMYPLHLSSRAETHSKTLSSRDNIHNRTLSSPYHHVTISSIRWIDIDLGREGVQMLKKRDPGGKEEMEEEHLLALILKEDAMTGQCKDKLKNYCKTLSDAKLTSEKVHKNLKDVCENGNAKEDKCKDLKENIKKKCTELREKLNAHRERPIENENCEKYELQCLFLEGACSSELTEKCSELRNECYETKRNKVADEIALRALKGTLKEGKDEECEEKLKEHCQILGRMSQELMEKCLDPKEACKNFKRMAKDKCITLKRDLENAFKDIKDDSCLPLLEECYFYGPNCEEKDRPECEKLKKECEEKYDIVYTSPEEPWIPIQPAPSIEDKVGLEQLYEVATKKGMFIEKLHVGMEDLIFFLSQKSQGGNFDQGEFKKIDKKKCDYLKTLSGDSNYDCDKLKDKYNQLKGKFDKERKDLEERIKDTGLFNEKGGAGDAEIIPWHKLDSDFNGRKCTQLQSDCFFLSRYNNDLKIACDNVQAMCYSRGLNMAAYETLEDQMRGEFRDLGPNWPNQCQKKLVEVCDKVKNRNHVLLALCSDPEDTCFSLFNDIQAKTYELKDILNFRRDFPKEHDCLKLEPKCYKLKEESNEVLGEPCHTLERNCYHLRESQKMRNLLLEEKKNYFENIENCTSILDKKCQNWSRKVNKQFSLSCALQNDTCTIMTSDIILHCDNLKKNINESNIVTKLTDAKGKTDELRKLCLLWAPYCDALLPSCQSELAEKENNDTLCPKIQKLCKPYQERQALEDEVLYKFRGNLNGTDTCSTRLKEHCVTWTQNDTFGSLCNDINDSKKGDKVKELCERLVDRVKKLCKKLPDKLKKENEELAKKIKVYDDLKNKAENATKGTNVILTFSIENNTTNKTNTTSHALVKRSEHHPTIAETEAQAFDLVAIVVTEYVDLKEKCEKLLLDCGFKECKDSENTCKEINDKCGALKPLEMKPPQVITNTETSTSTVTEKVTVDSEGKTICTSGAPSISMNCTSIHTTDTWVTHTSTHTSTMTKTSTVTSKVTIVSTKKCQPTQCTTDRTYPTHSSGGEEAGDVKPSGGIRVNGWGTSGMILMIVLSMIYF